MKVNVFILKWLLLLRTVCVYVDVVYRILRFSITSVNTANTRKTPSPHKLAVLKLTQSYILTNFMFC